MAIEWKKNDLPTLAQKVADDASETCQNFIYLQAVSHSPGVSELWPPSSAFVLHRRALLTC